MDELELAEWIGREAAQPVRRLDRVGYGASRATFIADLGGDDLVARVDTGDGPMAGTELSLHREAVVYRALAGTGVRIPRLRAESVDGTTLLIERASGTHEMTALADADRFVVYDDYVDALAELHMVDAGRLDLPGYRHPVDGPGHAREELDLWRTILRSRTSGPWSLAHFALAVLEQVAPASVSRTVLCHGDVGPGNFMHDGRRVTALLDWEFSHLGDPMDDLGWWVFRGHDMAGGCGDLAAQLRRWSAATGLPVDPVSIDYYRALVMVRWLVCVASALDNGGGGMDRSVYFGLVPVLAVRITRALASLTGHPLADPPTIPEPRRTPTAGVIDALAADLRGVIGPAATGSEAKRRLAAAELYLSHLHASDAMGPDLRSIALGDTARLLGEQPENDAAVGAIVATKVRSFVDSNAGDPGTLLDWFWNYAHRQVALWPLVAARALTPPTIVPTSI